MRARTRVVEQRADVNFSAEMRLCCNAWALIVRCVRRHALTRMGKAMPLSPGAGSAIAFAKQPMDSAHLLRA